MIIDFELLRQLLFIPMMDRTGPTIHAKRNDAKADKEGIELKKKKKRNGRKGKR